jgi:radical SAM superfamily enzyme YgiQ (UPF0313 family)
LPIVWGGTHPSIAPEQTCAHPLVDVVVAGQGEATFMDLVEALRDGRPLESVAGIYFKRDGEVVKTACRQTVDIDQLPPLPFELVDVDRFVMLYSAGFEAQLSGRRGVTYYTSYGCPFSCSFCSEPLTSNRRWFTKSPERVIEEISVLREKFNVDVVLFEDPIFFVDVRRVRKIAEMMIERGWNMSWGGSSRLETIKKIDAETWEVLKRSGFMQVFVGVESASPVVLKAIGKRYSADDIVEASRICYEQDVRLVCSFIQGIPVEAPGRTLADILHEDMQLASKTILRMYEANPRAQIGVLLYTPYPGSVAYHLGTKHGFTPPDSLEGWTNFMHQQNQVPWMLPEQEVFAQVSGLAMKALKGQGRDLKRLQRKKVKGALLLAYSAITRARYRHGYFKYPVEQHLVKRLARRMVLKRDPDSQNRGMLI